MGRLLDWNETTSFSYCDKFSAATTIPDSNCTKNGTDCIPRRRSLNPERPENFVLIETEDGER